MTAGRPSARRSLAVAAFTSALLAIVVAAGGCELVVGDTVPAYYCTAGANACPAGQVCDISKNKCVDSCVMGATRCSGDQKCNVVTGICESTDGGMVAEVSVGDDGPGPDTSDVVVDSMT
jgi:hypothetical protein